MLLFYSDHFVLPLPEGHRFPMAKYGLLRRQVMETGLVPAENLREPAAATDSQLTLVHHPEYVCKVASGHLNEREIRRMGFPWSLELVERSRRSVGATIAASRAALEGTPAANLAGGTHHAYPDHGEGFCVFNDVAAAARLMQAEGRCRRVLIVDCDVHQGNGTAAIFTGDPSVFTFSIHAANNFPFHKEDGSLDVALPDGTGDEAYLEALAAALTLSFKRADPGLVIYLAGADPYLGDSLGRLSLSKKGLGRRDQMVFETCRSQGMPLAITMSGGYARDITDTVDIHFQTLQIAQSIFGPET
jgi:acetoin utilization deacetylase AcuC-like enzyme